MARPVTRDVIKLVIGDRLFSWQCKKQHTVSNSTTEAEYVDASACFSQVIWMQHQLLDYGLTFLNTPIFCDNEAAVLIVKNPVQHSKTKHIDIKNDLIPLQTSQRPLLESTDMAEMIFVANYNLCAFTLDPPEEFEYFRSMVVGLTLSPINFAVMENPIIYRTHIQEFWSTATIHPNDHGEECIIGTVQAKRVRISEAVIRTALQFGDLPAHPTKLNQKVVTPILTRMGYEGPYPPLYKKLLHPYWRYLAHVCMNCLSGRKGGFDEINTTISSVMVALTMSLDYNFSKMVFEEFKSNLEGGKKDIFFMYPRFLQIILNRNHADLEPTVETLDLKAIGPMIFKFMNVNKQARRVYQGLHPLEKFGRFAALPEEDIEEPAVQVQAEVADEQIPPVQPQNEQQLEPEPQDPIEPELEDAEVISSSNDEGTPERPPVPINRYIREMESKRHRIENPPLTSSSNQDEKDADYTHASQQHQTLDAADRQIISNFDFATDSSATTLTHLSAEGMLLVQMIKDKATTSEVSYKDS
ncbi:hypothetical protein L1987_54382 [Smallanthus sonchifolius]|uniref:Uncharacterized protein n=1 Tax=Smallanthus sonchifolius TaxID=185202 RepID=A0ACB9E7E8_9ASTR|nr:hypothetical protein L1987_54382 [Smallanthus sonchifolius]